MIAFQREPFLLLLPLAACAAGYLWFLLRRRGSQELLRELPMLCAVFLLLLLALAGPYRGSENSSASLPLLLDVSESMDAGETERLLERAHQLADASGMQLVAVPFADQVARVDDAAPRSAYNSFRQALSRLNPGATNIERALQYVARAAGRDGAGKRHGALLITDGYSTRSGGDSSGTGLGALAIFPLTPDESRRERSEFRIVNLSAPLVSPAQQGVEIRTSILNSSDVIRRGTLEIQHDGKTLVKKAVDVEPGRELLVTSLSDPSKEGIKEVSARFVPDDSQFAPSSETVYIAGEKREKVLLLSGSNEDARYLAEVLSGQAYQLAAKSSEQWGEIPPLSEFSAVIINNVAAKQLPAGVERGIIDYVRNGGGLVMVGGNRGYGLGGYHESPTAEVLPVEPLPPQTVAKRLNVAVQLVIDKSQSMASGGKLDFAKEAAREVIHSLKDDDLIGVTGFDSAPFLVVKLGRVGEIRDTAIRRVGTLFPANKTNLFPAIDEARRSLVSAPAGRKHIIILTDGQIPDGGPYYVEIVKQMRLLGITVSTIMLGAETDIGLLREMAEEGGGAFYQTVDPRALPRIFVSDVKTMGGERTMRETSQYEVRPGPGGVSSTEIREFPPIRGYVQTKVKDRARYELLAYGGGKAEPLLASWSFGKGRSIAFTSDANGRWSNLWLEWPRYARFWSELLSRAREGAGDSGERIEFDLRHFVERGALNLDLTVFTSKAPGVVRADLIQPDGSSRQVSFTTAVRGRYLAEVGKITAGKHELRLFVDGTPLTPVAFYLSGELFGEQRGRGFDLPYLARLAEQSAGKLNPAAEDLKDLTAVSFSREPLGHWFLLAALLLFLLEVVRREVWRSTIWQKLKSLMKRTRRPVISLR